MAATSKGSEIERTFKNPMSISTALYLASSEFPGIVFLAIGLVEPDALLFLIVGIAILLLAPVGILLIDRAMRPRQVRLRERSIMLSFAGKPETAIPWDQVEVQVMPARSKKAGQPRPNIKQLGSGRAWIPVSPQILQAIEEERALRHLK